MIEERAGTDRLISALWHISDDREKLEKLKDLLNYTTAEQLQQDITAAREFVWRHLDN